MQHASDTSPVQEALERELQVGRRELMHFSVRYLWQRWHHLQRDLGDPNLSLSEVESLIHERANIRAAIQMLFDEVQSCESPG